MPGFLSVQRNQALELLSTGLVWADFPLERTTPERDRILELARDLQLPAETAAYFQRITLAAPGRHSSFSVVRPLMQAALFLSKNLDTFDARSFRKAADQANLDPDWNNPAMQSLLSDLPVHLAVMRDLPQLQTLSAALAFRFQTGQYQFLQLTESALPIITQFSRQQPHLAEMILVPNPLQIPELTFITKGQALYLQMEAPCMADLLKAYLHSAFQRYRMELMQLSWQASPDSLIDLSALALKGKSRETSLEGTLQLVETALVDCLAALLLPGTTSEKKERLTILESQGLLAAKKFSPLASYPVFEAELPYYIRLLQAGEQ